jgi:hypothetical protein
LTGSRDAQFLIRLTTLPEGFVTLTLGMMDRLDLWWSDGLLDLEATLQQQSSNFAEVDASLHSLVEEFWTLETFREGRQYGGSKTGGSRMTTPGLVPFLVM